MFSHDARRSDGCSRHRIRIEYIEARPGGLPCGRCVASGVAGGVACLPATSKASAVLRSVTRYAVRLGGGTRCGLRAPGLLGCLSTCASETSGCPWADRPR
eukprot:scaffold87191_cov33-Tisochrysis_lutea.AAC.1